MSSIPEFLDRAEQVLSDLDAADDDVERVINDIIRLDVPSGPDGLAGSQINQVTLERVIAVLQARRAAVAAELAEVGQQRADLAKRHRGVEGYTRSSV